MTLTEFRYWHWLAMAIGASLLAILAHRWSEQDAGSASLPADLSGQQQRFERALCGRVEGRPMLSNITVYPRQLTGADGSARAVHLVSAQYCSGFPEYYDGAPRYVWRASLFVLPIPYHPTPDLAKSDPKLAEALAKRSPPGGKATVFDLLAAERSLNGIGYSYAWWDAHFLLLVGGGSLLLIGVILPNALHVARFGHLKPAGKRKPRVAAPSLAATVEVAAESPDSSNMEDSPAPKQGALPAAAPVPVLTGAPIESVAPPPAPESDPAAFGMKRDDYYPTVRHQSDRAPTKKSASGR